MSDIQYTLGANLQVDVSHCIKALWGPTKLIWNYFSQTGMQAAAYAYAFDVSISAGDSEGWHQTIQSIANRSKSGFSYGNLRIGYPGWDLEMLLQSQHGPRWLGVLAIASLIPDETCASDQLHAFLKRIATIGTTDFVLDHEQTQKMWCKGREIFLDTAVQRRFLGVVKDCVDNTSISSLNTLFPNTECFFAPTMIACLRVWELSAGKRKTSRLWASGSAGLAHMILYLSVVCGFYVTARMEKGEVHYGDESQEIEVVIVADSDMEQDWITGYLMEDTSIENTVRHVLTPGVSPPLSLNQSTEGTQSESLVWRTEKRLQPRHLSTYTLNDQDNDDLRSPGLVTMLDLTILKRKLQKVDAIHTVSNWLRNYLLRIMPIELVSEEVAQGIAKPSKCQLIALSERMLAAIQRLDPGLIMSEHREQLVEEMRNGKAWSDTLHPYEQMRKEAARQMCTYPTDP